MIKIQKTRLKIRIYLRLLLFPVILPVGAFAAQTSNIVTPKPILNRTPANPSQLTKADALNHLKNIQKRQYDEIVKLEGQIRNRLRDSTSIRLKDDTRVEDKRAEKIASQITELENTRSELIARRVFIDRLILAIDTRWNGKQDLKQFLEHQLLDMANADLTSPQTSNSIWKFILYASIVVREIPERSENPLSILENYMEFTTVLNPKPPGEYAAGRHYTNGSQSYTAKPSDREKLGEYLETRLKQLKLPATGVQPKIEQPSPPDIEIRLRSGNPVPFEAEEPERKPEPTITY